MLALRFGQLEGRVERNRERIIMAISVARYPGGSPWVVRGTRGLPDGFHIDDTVGAGQPVVAINGAGSNNGAIGDPSGVTNTSDQIGLTTEAGTVSTTKGAAGVEVEVVVTYSGYVYEAPLSGATTIGTAIVEYTNTTQNTNATVVTTAANGWGATELDDFAALFCRSGANAGQIRKISANATTTFTVVQPFDNTIEINDVFIVLQPGLPGNIGRFQMTTDFQAIDNTEANDISSLTVEGICFGYENLDESGNEKVLFSWRSAVDQLAVS